MVIHAKYSEKYFNSTQNVIPEVYKSFSVSRHVALGSITGGAISYLHGNYRLQYILYII